MQTLIAILFLLGVVLVPCAYALIMISRRGNYSLWEFCLYSLAYSICRGLWRVEVEHRSVLPQSSGNLFVANHRSSIDPFLIQLAVGRRVHWMVAGEYCRHFLFGPILKLLQVIPTNRGGIDTAATKQAIRLLQEGRWVGMFPEGRINRSTLPLMSIRPGAALVAERANANLIPIWIEGSPQSSTVWGPLLTPARVQVRVGEPIPPPNQNDQEQEKARRWIVAAMEEVCRLGNRKFDPIEIAGKKWVQD